MILDPRGHTTGLPRDVPTRVARLVSNTFPQPTHNTRWTGGVQTRGRSWWSCWSWWCRATIFLLRISISILNITCGKTFRASSSRVGSGRVGSAKDGVPNEQVPRAGLPHPVVAQCLGLADEGVAINGPSHGLGAALFKGCHSGRVGSGRPWLSWWPLWPWWPPPPILINDIRCQSRSGPGQPTFLHPPSHPTHPHTHHPHRHHTHTQTHSKMCSRQQPSCLMVLC